MAITPEQFSMVQEAFKEDMEKRCDVVELVEFVELVTLAEIEKGE